MPENFPTREASEMRTGRPIIPPPTTGEVATQPSGGETAVTVATGSSWTEALAGVAVIVLSIIALAGGIPWVLMPIAVIILGAALLFEGATTTARFSQLLSVVGPREMGTSEFGGGATAEFLGGVTGIVLGILALVGVYPLVLGPIAVLVLGVVTLLSTGTNWRFSRMSANRVSGGHEIAQAVTGSMVASSCGTQAATGVAAVILTILAIIGLHPLVLTLVALLCLGAAVVVVGGSVGSRMFSLFRE